MPVTIKELALALELDHSTVGYALSGKGTIKEETRRRVREKAAELGYVPNAIARRMRTQKTGTIGLVVPDVVLIYNELVQHIFRGAIARGSEVQIALHEFNADLEDRALRSLLEARVDGIILKSHFDNWENVPESHALRQVAAQNVPTVCYSYSIANSPFPTLALAVERQGEMAAEHLLGLGHRDFAWLFPVEEFFRAQTDRLAGSRRALAKCGLSLPDSRVLSLRDQGGAARKGDDFGNYLNQALPRTGIEIGRQLLRRAMGLSPRPTAILAQNEATAIGAIFAAQELGLQVPRDLAIVATNRTLAAELSPFSLSTVDIPAEAAAQQCLELLWKRIEGHPAALLTFCEPQLQIGASSQAGL